MNIWIAKILYNWVLTLFIYYQTRYFQNIPLCSLCIVPTLNNQMYLSKGERISVWGRQGQLRIQFAKLTNLAIYFEKKNTFKASNTHITLLWLERTIKIAWSFLNNLLFDLELTKFMSKLILPKSTVKSWVVTHLV